MLKFTVGEKAKIVSMPEKGRHLLEQVVTIILIGGFGYEDNDVVVVTEEHE